MTFSAKSLGSMPGRTAAVPLMGRDSSRPPSAAGRPQGRRRRRPDRPRGRSRAPRGGRCPRGGGGRGRRGLRVLQPVREHPAEVHPVDGAASMRRRTSSTPARYAAWSRLERHSRSTGAQVVGSRAGGSSLHAAEAGSRDLALEVGDHRPEPAQAVERGDRLVPHAHVDQVPRHEGTEAGVGHGPDHRQAPRLPPMRAPTGLRRPRVGTPGRCLHAERRRRGPRGRAPSTSSPAPASPSSGTASATPQPSASAHVDQHDPGVGPGRTLTLAFWGDVHFEDYLSTGGQGPARTRRARCTLGAADLSMVNLETAVTERGRKIGKEFHFRRRPPRWTPSRAQGSTP